MAQDSRASTEIYSLELFKLEDISFSLAEGSDTYHFCETACRDDPPRVDETIQ